MKNKRLLNLLLGSFLAAALAISTAGCLISGFDLPMESLTKLYLICLVSAFLSALILQLRFGAVALLTITILLTLAMWHRGALQEQVLTMAMLISTHYHQIYNWPLVGAQAAAAVDAPLILLSCWTTACTAFYYFGCCHLIVLLPLVFMPPAACMVVTHTVPDAVFLFILLFVIAVLLLTDWARSHDSEHHAALVLRMMLPAAIFLGLIFALNPREGYVSRADEFQNRISGWFNQLQQPSESSPDAFDTIGSKSLDLKTVGPKSTLSYAVMRVSSPISGRIYLRGQAYNVYTGTGWESSGSRNESFTRGRNTSGTLTITTYGTRDLLYVPYYPSDVVTLTGGRLENPEKLDRYSYSLAVSAVYGSETPGQILLVLPEDTAAWAKSLSRLLTSGCDTEAEIIQAIADYVSSSADYELNTARMPSDRTDFAHWFLEESDTGYCVHFATAATILLRASDIPARYVEGYMFDCGPDGDAVVTGKDAHAWAEYYDSDSGAWKILEATPGGTEAIPVPTDAPEESASATLPQIKTQPEETIQNRPVPENNNTESDIQSEQPEETKSIRWLVPVIQIFFMIAAIFGQAELRIRRKYRHWNQGTPNRQALNRWKQVQCLGKHTNTPIPDELHVLTEKALYSQHTLSKEELAQYDLFRCQALEHLAAMNPVRKWILRLIFAIGQKSSHFLHIHDIICPYDTDMKGHGSREP